MVAEGAEVMGRKSQSALCTTGEDKEIPYILPLLGRKNEQREEERM